MVKPSYPALNKIMKHLKARISGNMKKIKVLKTLHALIAGRHLIMPHIFTEHIVISVINVPTTAQVAIEKLL